MVNTCAVMTGLIISYINNTILAYLALFGFTIVAIYSVLLLLIFQMKQL